MYVLYGLTDLRNKIVYVGAPLKFSHVYDNNIVIKGKIKNVYK